MKKVGTKNSILLLLLLALFDVLAIHRILELGVYFEYQSKTISDSFFRKTFYSESMRENVGYWSKECITFLKNVENEAVYFPIPTSSVDKSLRVAYTDSWMDERNFQGERGHEGTDIMAIENQRGLYPVVSVSDGRITNLGWLDKGGYRVGVTSDSGTYYYYAHLESYSGIAEGDEIMAGQLLGYMGDSGYGPEGTVGHFDVHLHFGIYCYQDGKEVSVNPYFLLKALEKHKLKYSYS